jgi:hypothetical protein
MNEKLLTVKEVSDITGLTTQNIYQQLETNLKPYIVKIGKRKMLKNTVVTEHYKIELPNDLPSDLPKSESAYQTKPSEIDKLTSENQVKTNSENEFFMQYIKDELKRKDDIIKEKEKIIIDKDVIIQELTNKLTEQMDNTNNLSNRIAELFENSQQLQQNQQLLEAKYQEKEDEPEPKKKKEKWGLFKKRNTE